MFDANYFEAKIYSKDTKENVTYLIISSDILLRVPILFGAVAIDVAGAELRCAEGERFLQSRTKLRRSQEEPMRHLGPPSPRLSTAVLWVAAGAVARCEADLKPLHRLLVCVTDEVAHESFEEMR